MADDKSTKFLKDTGPVPGGKAANGPAVVVLIHPPGPYLGRRFELSSVEHVLGRLDELEMPIVADGVSRRHARFLRSSAGWQLEDLGSTNGTYVNDERLAARRLLVDGDLLRVGTVIAKFLSSANLEAAYHEEIYRMSVIDALTGAHNKRYFLEFLEREIAGSSRHGMPLSLVMLDIDHFKKVNDTHGHLAGDEVLKEIGRRLRQRMRREDLVARYGGEEFGCVLTKTNRDGALLFADSLRLLVADTPCPAGGDLRLPITISLGLAEMPPQQPCTPEQLIGRADQNLYKAKHAGRNRVVG